MKIAEVVVGQTYLTKISGFRAPVVVRRATEDHNGRKRFEVSRPGAPHKLMRRTAAALHPIAPKPAAPAPTSGYVPCACRDCMETAIGSADALCHACVAAGCEPHAERECASPAAYGGSDE